MGKIRILIADDHVVVREGTRQILEMEPDLKVVAEAGDGEEAVRLVGDSMPDVAIIDIAMPKVDGIEATKQIKALYPTVAVLILSAYDDDQFIFNLLEAGAAGYLLKTASGEELSRAIRAVYKGEPVLDPTIARKVMNYFRLPGKVRGLERPSEHLSNRETDIIKLAARGMTNKDIADRLHLSNRTVEGHLRAIFNKLGVGSRTEAVLYGLRKGWFTLEELP